jgi:hypothetical protein
VDPAPDRDLEAAITTFMATGLDRWDAIVALAESGVDLGPLGLAGVPREWFGSWETPYDALDTMAFFGTTHPEGANALLNVWLEGRNLTNLDLSDWAWVRSLPAGLDTDCLNLDHSGIVTLPAGLNVWELRLAGCTTWDGRIPEDARVRGELCTDTHRRGITLAAWRALHPNGERPPPSYEAEP